MLWTLLIGFSIGLLARLLWRGRAEMGVGLTCALGVGGALAGTYGGHLCGLYRPGEPGALAAAFGGAILLLCLTWVSRDVPRADRAE